MTKYCFLLISLILILVSCKKETEPERLGDLKGNISNEYGQPLKDAVITIGSRTNKSSANGDYYFEKLLVGECQVSVTMESYLFKTQNAVIIENEVNILDFALQAGETNLELSDSQLNVIYSASYADIDVKSNASWQVKDSSSWLECIPESGEGNEEIRLKWLSNSGTEKRTDSVFVKSGNIEKKIVVTQGFSLRILSVTGLMGNGKNEVQDSALIIFNKPVNVDHITSQWEMCITTIGYISVENNYGVKFSYACADLGGQYPFEVAVTDSEGIPFSQTVNVPFYANRIDIEGYITDFFMTTDTKNCWISTKNPDRLMYVSCDSMTIQRSFDMDFPPRQFTLNPYNQLLYVLSGNPDNYLYENIIYVINPVNGAVIKEIVIYPEEGGHPAYPTIYPYSIGFANTGYGAILLHQDGSSGMGWRVLDSANGDTVYFHEAYGYENGQYPYFQKVHLNYDKTRILLTELYGSCEVDVLDGTTHEIVNIIPGSLTRGVFITPNRNNERIYFGQLYDQFIMDLDGNMSQISYLTNFGNTSADFTYREGKDDFIYFVDEEYLQVMDYEHSETPVWFDVIYELSSFTSSLDGKNAFAYKNYNGSFLYKFNTDDFWMPFESQ